MDFGEAIAKMNSNHDQLGRFSTGSGGAGGTKYIDGPNRWGDSGDYVAYRAGDLKTDRGLLSFARTEKYAQAYGENVEKYVVTVKNPYAVDATGMTPVGAVRKAYMELTGKELKFDSGKRSNKEIWRAADKKMASILEKDGKDALVYKNMGDSDELLLVAKRKDRVKPYSEIAKARVPFDSLYKHAKHNQKDHTPYSKRSKVWAAQTHLPYKEGFKGKGLGARHEKLVGAVASGRMTAKEAMSETVKATGTKGKAAKKTAAAVLAANRAPETAPRQVVSTIPDPKSLKKVPGHIGGTGEKHLYQDADGNQYMFKPAQTKRGVTEPFRADIQEAASNLSRMIKTNPLDTVEVKKVTLEGRVGTLQKMLPATGDIRGMSVKSMNAKQRQQILEEHTVDWLLGNFDAHSGQFLQMRTGRLVGVDKDQSFRFIDEPQTKKMSLTYDPNGVAPVYNTLFAGHKNGAFKLDLDSVGTMVRRVESIPDATYRENFRSYAEGIHGKGTGAEALLDKIVTRKQSLKSDYEVFFGQTLGAKNADGTPFNFSDSVTKEHAPRQTAREGETMDFYAAMEELGVDITKHLAGRHNQRDHAPYRHRSKTWAMETHLPYKEHFKGKGLAGRHEHLVGVVSEGKVKSKERKAKQDEARAKIDERRRVVAEVKAGLPSTTKGIYGKDMKTLLDAADKLGVPYPSILGKPALAYHVAEACGRRRPDPPGTIRGYDDLLKVHPTGLYRLATSMGIKGASKMGATSLAKAIADERGWPTSKAPKVPKSAKAKGEEGSPKLDVDAKMRSIKPKGSWAADKYSDAEDYIKKHAKRNGMTETEYKDAVVKKVTKYLDEADIKMRIDANVLIDRIINGDGYFKNQHATRSTGGALSPGPDGMRARAESTMFSISKTTATKEDWIEHPVYGYAKGPNDSASHIWYGTEHGGLQVSVKFNPSVKEQATYTFGDSLGEWYVPIKHSEAKNAIKTVAADSESDILQTTRLSDFHSSYTEVQLHGGITRADIAEVSLLGDNTSYQAKQAAKQLTEAGVPWTWGTKHD